MPDSKKQNYVTGYGKPPVATQWQPGQSGNPKGRKRRADLTAQECLARALSHRVDRPINMKNMTLREAIFYRAATEAAKGETTPMRELFKLMKSDAPAADTGWTVIDARVVLEDEAQEETRATWLVKDNDQLRRRVEELEAQLKGTVSGHAATGGTTQ